MKPAYQGKFRACFDFNKRKHAFLYANKIDFQSAVLGTSPVCGYNNESVGFEKFTSQPFSVSSVGGGITDFRPFTQRPKKMFMQAPETIPKG
jgi:hypothetical protein